MNPNSTSCITGNISASRSVPRSRTMCMNSFRNTARKDRHMSDLRLAAPARGVLGQFDEHVLERRADVANLGVREAARADLGQEIGVAAIVGNDRVHRLAEDGRAQAPGAAANEGERARRL